MKTIAALLFLALPLTLSAKPPNILLILADDLGYGDIGCYNPESKVPTPHIDRLAADGMRFTDAHSPSTVCTPTRYSVLTGRMAFRNGMRGVFTGAGGPCLIEEGRLTLPGMLQNKGYTTACIGKWHIGMTFYDKAGKPILDHGLGGVKRIDYARPITDGPIHRGFNAFYGTACCPTTDWLYAWIVQDRVLVPPTKILDKTGLPKHPYSRDNRGGMIAPDFDLEEVDMMFLKKSQDFLTKQVEADPDTPFFLYHATQAVHLPSFPGNKFKGKTQAGPHGDFIFELDYVVGELMKTITTLGIAKDTLVIFTSDNGPEIASVINMRKDHQHDGARPWRGIKRDNWEGGHRVPFIARWVGQIAPGTTNDQLVSLTDIMATCAALVDAELPENAAEDSFNMLPVLLGEQGNKPVRDFLLHQTMSLDLGIRRAHWKYLDHKGSAGNRYNRRGLEAYAIEDNAPDTPGQLYNLKEDPGERNNLVEQNPEIAQQLKAKLDAFKESGRSRP